ncbi:MAG: T9SS type A sorting domain-containing protein [Daejeonella sp.]
MKDLTRVKWIKFICTMLFFFTFSSGLVSFAQCGGPTVYGGDGYYSTKKFDKELKIPRYNNKTLFIDQNGTGPPATFINLGYGYCGNNGFFACSFYSIDPYYLFNNFPLKALNFIPTTQNLGTTKISVYFDYEGQWDCFTSESSGTALAYEFNVTVEKPGLNLVETNKIATICNNTNEINLNDYLETDILNVEYKLDGISVNPLITVDPPPYWVEQPCDPNNPAALPSQDGNIDPPMEDCGYYEDPPAYSYRNLPKINLGNLSLGIHTITAVKQYDNGIWSESFIINKVQPPPIPSVTVTNPKCSGETGSVLLADFKNSDGSNYAGGQNLILSLWNKTLDDKSNVVISGISDTVPNLLSGAYSATIENSEMNCASTFNFTIDIAPSAINPSATGQNPDCSTGTGTLTASASGGTAPYQYSLNGVDFQPSNIFTGLAGGTYSVVVKDANACISQPSAAVNISIPSAIDFTFTSTNLTGYESNDGQIIISASGGTGDYQYRLNSGAWQNDNTFTGLAAGDYQLEVNTNGTCISGAQSLTLSQPPPLSVGISSLSDVSCNGGNDGEIIAAAGGGIPGTYEYALTDAFPGGNSSGVFSSLAPGSYTVYVKDANNNKALVTATVAEPLLLTAAATKTDVTCNGAANGTVTIHAEGGNSPYFYSLDGGDYQSSETFTNVATGSHTILVRDSKNCTATGNQITISEPEAIIVSSVQQSATCYGTTTGKLTLNASGGLPPYQYSTDNGTSWSANNTFNGLMAGSYQAAVKDGTGCIKTRNINITEPEKLVLKIDEINHAACYGAEGNMTVSSTGGTGGITYSSIPSLPYANGVFSGALAGTYTIIATDANNCSSQESINITQPDDLLISSDVNAVSCTGGNNGTILLHATGGPAAQAEYVLISGTAIHPDPKDNTFTGLSAGSYTFKIQQGACETNYSVDVPEPDALTLQEKDVIPVSAFGGNDGSFSIEAGGGNGGYTYTLNGANQGTQSSYTNLAAGPYQVKVTDSKGCSTEIYVVVSEPNTLALQVLAKKDVSCYQAKDGSIEVAGDGGYEGYSYSIDGGVNYQTSGKFSGLAGGSYLLYVKDASGYTNFQTTTIKEPAQLNLSYTAVNPLCYGGLNGEINLTVTGGTKPYTYSWPNNPLIGNVAKAVNLKSGAYPVLVTDANGCSIQKSIELADPKQIQIVGIQDTVLCKGQQIVLDAGNPGLTYQWSADNGFTSQQKAVTLEQAGKYQLTITNPAGCTASRSFTITTSNTLLKAEFLLPSFVNAGDTAIVIDISKPTPSKVAWVLAPGATVAGSNAGGSIRQLTFTDPGTYTIQMMVSLGECADAIQKTITILPKGQTKEAEIALGYQAELLKVFKVYPNPSSGKFKAGIELSEKADIQLRLLSFANNQLIETREEQNKDEYTLEFDHPELLPGMYILTLNVGKQVKVIKLIKL